MAGFGTTTFGTGAYGTGAAPTLASAPPRLSLNAKAFDPLTRDYIFDINSGEYQRWPRTRQRVWLALSTKKGDLVGLPSWGLSIPDKVTDSFDADVRLAVEDALRPIRECQLADVLVQLQGSRLALTIHYVDLDTGLPGDLGILYGA